MRVYLHNRKWAALAVLFSLLICTLCPRGPVSGRFVKQESFAAPVSFSFADISGQDLGTGSAQNIGAMPTVNPFPGCAGSGTTAVCTVVLAFGYFILLILDFLAPLRETLVFLGIRLNE